jgi:hypothetical protein
MTEIIRPSFAVGRTSGDGVATLSGMTFFEFPAEKNW